ncbi:MAG: transposase-like protein [Chlamydiales bacterium]
MRTEQGPRQRDRLVALFAESELTVKDFAAKHGVKLTTLRNWPYKRSQKAAAKGRVLSTGPASP